MKEQVQAMDDIDLEATEDKEIDNVCNEPLDHYSL